MSLDWNAEKVRDLDMLHGYDIAADKEMYEEGTPEHHEALWQRSVTQAVVWRMFAVSIGWKITETNVEKLAIRSAIADQIHGPSLTQWDDDKLVKVALSYEDFHRRIGLTTNVSAITDAAFKKAAWSEIEKYAKARVRVAKSMYEEHMEEVS